MGIADLLKQTTGLRTFRYSLTTEHDGGGQNGDWNLCKFIMEIAREAGGHLECLSVKTVKLHGSILPGSASMRGFKRLRQLEIALELATCDIVAAAAYQATSSTQFHALGYDSTENDESGNDELFLSDLVPASVSHQSLRSCGTGDHAEALYVLFRHFAITKESTLPALEKFHLSYLQSAGDAYKEQCDLLLAETEEADVVLHLVSSLSFPTIRTGNGQY